MTEPLLQINDVHVNFAGRQGLVAGLLGRVAPAARAVDGVDLEVAPGEILALAGESGCGKTTLARSILGLQKVELDYKAKWWWAVLSWVQVVAWVSAGLSLLPAEFVGEGPSRVVTRSFLTSLLDVDIFRGSPWMLAPILAATAILLQLLTKVSKRRQADEAAKRTTPIVFDGKAIGVKTKDLRKLRRRVQLIFQDPAGALNPRQTIYETVAEGIRIHKIPGNEEELVAEALSMAGLRPPERFFLRYAHEVSGGQRQRVVIAGALALKPDLLVADEPVSALDASVRGEILKLLLKLRDELGLAIIVVTHDLGLAWMIADRVAVMYLGRIVEIGPTEDVLGKPMHPYTQALLSVVPETKGVQQVILTGEPPDPTRIPGGCRFHARCPLIADGTAERMGVLQRCKTEDLALTEAAEGHMAACYLAGKATALVPEKQA